MKCDRRHSDAISRRSSQSTPSCRSSKSRLSLASKLSSKQNAEFKSQNKVSELNEMRTRAKEEAYVESEMEPLEEKARLAQLQLEV